MNRHDDPMDHTLKYHIDNVSNALVESYSDEIMELVGDYVSGVCSGKTLLNIINEFKDIIAEEFAMSHDIDQCIEDTEGDEKCGKFRVGE